MSRPRCAAALLVLLSVITAQRWAAGGQVDDVVGALDSADPVVRRAAVQSAAGMRVRGAAVVPALERALRREAEGIGVCGREINWAAIEAILGALSAMGADSLGTLSRIALRPWCDPSTEAPERCGDADVALRGRAFAALGNMGAVAVPTLVACLHGADWWARNEAASTLGRIGPDASDAKAALLEALRDKNERVRETAGWALSRLDGR